jgi:hypothetical protein
MTKTLRPPINLTDFKSQIPATELQVIIKAVEDAMQMTMDIEGVDPFIPHFRAIYSSCLFPRIWGKLEEVFAGDDSWEVKKSRMTFTLIKKGICQFHFYKGSASASFKATSKRQKAIVQGELYGDLEVLPSVILQHFSDRMNSQLVGFHALFFVRGKLVEDFDILHQNSAQQSGLSISPKQEAVEEVVPGLTIRFKKKDKTAPATPQKRIPTQPQQAKG